MKNTRATYWILCTLLSPFLSVDAAGESVPVSDRLNWIDYSHDWIYNTSHGAVVWLDTKFVDETQQEVVPTPPSRFRLGLQSSIELERDGSVSIEPIVDFSTDVELPNLEERFKLFITTRDPVALEGTDSFEQDNSLRVGASKGFLKNWDTSAGVKARWLPEVFTYVQWKREFGEIPGWTVNPYLKFFWENEDGFGASPSLVINQWKNRRLFRQSFSARISQKDIDQDEESAGDPDDPQFGDDGRGVRWQSSTILGYVPLLLDEKDYGRRIGGEDVARGIGLRGQVRGNAVKTLDAKVTLYMKGPLYKDFLYYILAPEVVWDEEEDWKEEYVLNFGVEMLIWGDDPIR